MKVFSLFFLLLVVQVISAQSSVNTTAAATPVLIFTVGDIYVLPPNGAPSTSGLLGVVTQTQAATLTVLETLPATLTAFPNPTHDLINIKGLEGSSHQAQVFDMSGRLIKDLKLQNAQLSLQSLVQGVYLIKFDNNQTIKIAIQ